MSLPDTAFPLCANVDERYCRKVVGMLVVRPSLSIFLTGRLVVEGPAGTFGEADLAGKQARVALASLTLERVPIDRDRLADMIWGEELPDQWSSSLNVLISKIRSLLARCGLDAKAILTSSGGAYAVNLPPQGWVDVEDAVRRLDRADAAARRRDWMSALPEATVASSILRRPFLGGVEGEWVDARRRRLQADLYHAYVLLAEGWIDRGNEQLSITIADQAITLDPLRETAYRLLMEAELSRGDSFAALSTFKRCEEMCRAELGAAPSRATVELAERSRQGT